MTDKQKTKSYKKFVQNSNFYRKVEKAARYEFGENSSAYKNILNNIDVQNGIGCNFLFAVFAQDKVLKNRKQICLLDEQYEFSKKCKISLVHPQLILYEKNSFSDDGVLLENLIKNLNGYDLPLLITNPVLKKDSNFYGFSLGIGPNTKIKTDKRFSNGNSKINLENGLEKSLWTKNRGYSKICSSINGVIANSSNLISSYEDSKVVVLK